MLARARTLLAPLAVCGICLAGSAVLAHVIGHHVARLFWLDVAELWCWQLFLAAAFLSAGHLALERVFRISEASPLERLSLSAAIGALIFALGMYLGGFLHLYGSGFAVALPTVMLASGARRTIAAFAPAIREWRSAIGPLSLSVSAVGFAAILMVYLGVLSPDSVNYDAAWNHLVIAQDYAREGHVVPFPGDWVKNTPHLSSVINTWSFLVPGFDAPALRWMMALHTEFAFFAWTLVHVSALASRLCEGRPLHGAWVAFFLFPAIFVYDSNLGGSSDHFAAFFAAPVLVAALRTAREPTRRAWALVAVLAAGALLTKAQMIYVLTPVAAFLAIAVLRHSWRTRSAGDLVGPAIGAACFVAVLSPHLCANAIFFRNPIYPMAQGMFTASTPTVPDAQQQIDYLFVDWRSHPPKDLVERMRTSAELLATFSLDPHYTYIGDRPYFGSLFTLALLLLPFVRATRTLWIGAAVALGALFVWAWTYRIDRNLQTCTPLLAAVTAAVLSHAWRRGTVARIGVAIAVGLQAVWGMTLMFAGSDRIASAIALVRSDLEDRSTMRYDGYRREYLDVASALPPNAVVLLHNSHRSLGIDRRVLLDWIGFQGLIDYRPMRTPRDVYDRFAAVGVTHVLSLPGARIEASKQEQVLFAAFMADNPSPRQRFGGFELSPMPATAPPQTPPLRVVVRGIHGYADGLYDVSDLSVCEEYPEDFQHYPKPRIALDSSNSAHLIESADALILTGAGAIPGFVSASNLGGYTVFLRHP